VWVGGVCVGGGGKREKLRGQRAKGREHTTRDCYAAQSGGTGGAYGPPYKVHVLYHGPRPGRTL
jgi:hypothetical protein